MNEYEYELWRESVDADHPWLHTELMYGQDGDIELVRMHWEWQGEPVTNMLVSFPFIASLDMEGDERWHLDSALQMLACRRSYLLNLN